ncbi:pentapeptide repeat-containing protein [Streptomyces sp. NBC_00876]|uniref:pentapeptide repeat-containing protein n=1 Tax=Streptomyces sp. NBC_00876 TaxID=2975853 RepID=UPI00386B3D73|nr:pentapeptide repeat-containing protein [Streptomyces sp. NBC_00876]
MSPAPVSTCSNSSCSGVVIPGNTSCLTHATSPGRRAYLAGLTPGSDIDHRGTPLPGFVLEPLLQALHDPATDCIRIGKADFRDAELEEALFDNAEFSGPAKFDGTKFREAVSFAHSRFLGGASFDGANFHEMAAFTQAHFSGQARFDEAEFDDYVTFDATQFSGLATFNRTRFSGAARFNGSKFDGQATFLKAQFSDGASYYAAQFSGFADFGWAEFSDDATFTAANFHAHAGFRGAQFTAGSAFAMTRFSGDAIFTNAHFSGPSNFGASEFSSEAGFSGARFSGEAGFGETQFSRNVSFEAAHFALTTRFGPVVCAWEIDLSGAVFEMPVTVELAARAVRFERTRWESTATLRLRHATVDLSHAVLTNPVAITAHPTPFMVGTSTVVSEDLLQGPRSAIRVASVRGVDAAHLVLTDVLLVDCLFAGAFHLDQLRLEGRCAFAAAPIGLHRRYLIWPYRWSRRRTLAEEHHWRAQAAGQTAPPAGRQPSPRAWRTGPHHSNLDLTPDPEDVATLYRQLRKAFEDGKNEPGAADFYYGEMEMRRHDRTDTPAGERFLLWGYWLLSGYGLRASRALGWLISAVVATIVLMMGLGLPDSSPHEVATGTVPVGGGQVTLTVDKEDPRLTLPVGDRFTGERADKAVQVVLNSVVFRASGQDLTTWGTYTEMVSRFTEPVLLALAVLAMRSRIKR